MLAQASIPPAPPVSFPGKEYSNNPDVNFAGVNDPHQNIVWDGVGGAHDTFDFTASLIPIEVHETEVDALANRTDELYSLVSHGDAVTMVASMTDLPEIYYTAAGHHGVVHANPPNVGVWATPDVINVTSLPIDVDGLEIWGPPDMDDAQKFSLIGDPPTGVGIGRVSVWNYSPGHDATPYIMAAQIANAIGRPELANEIDVDAMMVGDAIPDGQIDLEIDDTFQPGDSIMFSIAPIADFDGGEIWVWDLGAGPANYLTHGGEIWDTAHSVMDHFGVPIENINALEAVPEPGSLSLLLLAVMVVAGRVRCRAPRLLRD